MKALFCVGFTPHKVKRSDKNEKKVIKIHTIKVRALVKYCEAGLFRKYLGQRSEGAR